MPPQVLAPSPQSRPADNFHLMHQLIHMGCPTWPASNILSLRYMNEMLLKSWYRAVRDAYHAGRVQWQIMINKR